MPKGVPRKGSHLIEFEEEHFRWIAKGTRTGTVVRIQHAEIPDGQMLVGLMPRVFVDTMVEELIDFGADHGWEPFEPLPPITFERHKGKLRLVEEEEEL